MNYSIDKSNLINASLSTETNASGTNNINPPPPTTKSPFDKLTTKNILAEKQRLNINLNKKLYGYKGSLENLDEEFNFFKVTKYTAKAFFNLFDKFFYNLQRETLSRFMGESGSYIGGYKDPRDLEIQNLKDDITRIQLEIDSLEKEHPYFKNGKVIASSQFTNTPTAAVNQNEIYYMQSGKRRQILNSEIYRGMKLRTAKRLSNDQLSDKEFIIFIDNINLISEGPEINVLDDIYTVPGNVGTTDMNLYINKWPGTV